MLLLFTPGAPREDYFETLADAARREAMGEDDWTDFYLRHDTFWVDGRLVQRDRLRVVGFPGPGLRIDRRSGPPGTVGHHQVTRSCRSGALLAEQDRGAAAEAGLALAAEHPVVAAATRIAGGVLLGVVQVGPHQRAVPARPAARGPARRPPGSRGGRRGGTADSTL